VIIVNIIGGIGNQMFQYALYKNLKSKFPVVKLDISGFESYAFHNGYELSAVFNVDAEFASKEEVDILADHSAAFLSRIRRKIFGRKKTYYNSYIQKDFGFKSDVLKYDNMYLFGYWHGEKFFYDVRDAVTADFSFKEPLSGENLKIKELAERENSVSIHIRRGDYVTNQAVNRSLGNICTKEYYDKAIKTMNKKVKKPTYFVFSDDIKWAKDNFNLGNCYFISWNNEDKSYNDMHLMSICKHNIIANSSFSWWGAYLNANPDKLVVAPGKWFNDPTRDTSDYIPSSWEKIKI